MATVTSKMQLTLPAAIARQVGLQRGQKVSVTQSKGKIIITPMKSLIEKLAGSVYVPQEFKNKPLNEIIEAAKMEYFSKKPE